jgi:hypothetical protein
MQRTFRAASLVGLICIVGLLLYTADPYVAEFPTAANALIIKGKLPRILALFIVQALCIATIVFGCCIDEAKFVGSR